jgi:hypothetical protein
MSKASATSFAVGLAIVATVSSASAQDWRTITSLRQYKGENALSVDVEYGAGRLSIAPGETNALYKATLRYDAHAFRPVTQYQDGRLRVGIEGGSLKGRNMKSGRLDLALGTRMPIDLNLKFGAVRADVELGGLKIRSADIQTGASETDLTVSSANSESCSKLELQVGAAEFRASGLGNLNCERVQVAGGVGDVTLDFNGAWRVDADVDIDMGLGSLTLRLPRGLGVQVQKSGFLASFDSQGLVKRGNVYYSENWEKASNRASFKIDAAFGSVKVVWVEPEAHFTKAQR